MNQGRLTAPRFRGAASIVLLSLLLLLPLLLAHSAAPATPRPTAGLPAESPLQASSQAATPSPASATLALEDRVVWASQIYAGIQMYFGHWKGVPDLDLDKEYARYIRQVLASDSRRDFDLASMEFLASPKRPQRFQR